LSDVFVGIKIHTASAEKVIFKRVLHNEIVLFWLDLFVNVFTSSRVLSAFSDSLLGVTHRIMMTTAKLGKVVFNDCPEIAHLTHSWASDLNIGSKEPEAPLIIRIARIS
jgi:hypothetical protein